MDTPDDLDILVVEDTADDAELIVTQLEFLGHRGMIARDLLSGLEEAQTGRFDLVVLDLGLPDVTEPLHAIRTLAAQGMPVVVATNRNDAELAIAAIDAGAAQYVVKHRLDIDRLAETIDAARHIHRSRPIERSLAGDLSEDIEDLRSLLGTTIDHVAWVGSIQGGTDIASVGTERLAGRLGIPAADLDRIMTDAGWAGLRLGRIGRLHVDEAVIHEVPEAIDVREASPMLLVPVGDPPVGVLVGATTGGQLDAGDITIVQAAVRQFARAVARERDRQDAVTQAAAMRTASQVDALTGLLNRRGFDRILAIEEQRATRGNGDDAVIMVDLDGLKRINDSHGHAAGDALIKRAAEALDGALRGSDQLFRIGGDEFVILATECTPPGLDTLVSRLVEALDTAGVDASVGSASRRDNGTLQHALDAADAAMYLEKQRHRHEREHGES